MIRAFGGLVVLAGVVLLAVGLGLKAMNADAFWKPVAVGLPLVAVGIVIRCRRAGSPRVEAPDVQAIADGLLGRVTVSFHGKPDPLGEFTDRIVGVTKVPGRQEALMSCYPGEVLRLVRERRNPVDPNAVKVMKQDGRQLGYIPKSRAAKLGPAMDGGTRFSAVIRQLHGGGDRGSIGALVEVRRQ